MKQQINFRASELTIHQLEELASWWGVNQTEAITVVVDRIHRQEKEQRMSDLIAKIKSGEVAPEAAATDGETFFYKNTTEPMVSIGRVPGSSGQHVLRKQDGDVIVIGGYYLHRQNEEWSDFLA